MAPKNDLPPRPRRWWQHWFFKTVWIFALLIVVSLTAFYFVERELGERAWRNYQAKAAERGVKLRMEDYEPPAVPDEENYAAAPVFQKLFATPDGGTKTNELFGLPEVPRTKPGDPEPAPLDLTEWQKAFLKARWISSTTNNAASDVLKALERVEGTLSEIRLASARPKCRWPVKWSDGPGAKFPHYGTIQAASHCFAVRARALLALDKPDEALSELAHVIRIDQSIANEPTMLPFLVRYVLWSQVLDSCEQGIAAGKLKPAQLNVILNETNSVNFLREWKFALNSERGFGNHIFDKLAVSNRAEFAKAMNATVSDSFIWFAVPQGWVRTNQVEYNELIDRDLDDVDVDKERVSDLASRGSAQLMKRSSTISGRLRHLMVSIVYPVTEQASHRSYAMHNRLQQFEILCAIASFREAHGEAPESLNELVPKYLTAIPHDIMDGKRMRYRRNEDGGCAIWSIGLNRIDDNGTRGEFRSKRQAKDWVLEMPPVP